MYWLMAVSSSASSDLRTVSSFSLPFIVSLLFCKNLPKALASGRLESDALLLPPHHFQISRNVHGLLRPDHDLPARQALFEFAGEHGHLARNDQALVAELAFDACRLHGLFDPVGVELPGGPRGGHAHALGVGDEQPA